MTETNFNATFKSIFPNGKTSTKPGEITPQYVTAVCRVYENRSDSDVEYVIEEYGIIERPAYNSLAKCYVEASRTAYINMLSRIAELSGQEFTAPASVQAALIRIAEVIKQETDSQVVRQENPSKSSDNGEADEPDEPDNTSGSEDVLGVLGNGNSQPEPTVHKLDLNLGLKPASSIVSNKQEPDGDDEIAKAREMPITIVGKAHDCYGWTAGRILDELPEVIVNFTPKYSGEKKDEKAALMALYPEALRKSKQSA